MNSAGLRVSIGMSMILIVARAEAAPFTIFDAGNTKPITPYYELLTAGAARKGLRQSYGRAPDGSTSVGRIPVRRAIEVRDVIPIHTPEMHPGRVQPRFVATRLPHPLFLVGADADSLRWLVEHHKELLAMRATGMLVEVTTVEELRTVADAAQGLPIVPASASDIAHTLGIDRYPVLITHEGVEQ